MQNPNFLQKCKLHDSTEAQTWFYSTDYIEQCFAFSSTLDIKVAILKLYLRN